MPISCSSCTSCSSAVGMESSCLRGRLLAAVGPGCIAAAVWLTGSQQTLTFGVGGNVPAQLQEHVFDKLRVSSTAADRPGLQQAHV